MVEKAPLRGVTDGEPAASIGQLPENGVDHVHVVEPVPFIDVIDDLLRGHALDRIEPPLLLGLD
jgi:hypothetical protein